MTLHSKLLHILFLGFLFVILNAFFIMNLYKKDKENLEWVNHTHNVILNSEQLLSHLKDAETGQRGFLLTKNPDYLEPYYNGIISAKEYFQKLKKLTSDNLKQQERLNLIKKTIQLKFTELDETIKLSRMNDHSSALELVKQNIGKEFMDNLRDMLNEFIDIEKFLLKKRESKLKLNYTRLVFFLIFELILFIFINLLIIAFLNKNLFTPLKLLLSSTQKMEKDEKIDIKDSDIISNNEIGSLLASFLKMHNKVSERTKELKDYKDELELKVIERTEELKLFHSAVEQSKSSIYITDKNGLIEYVNPHFSKVTGYTPEEIIGKNPRIFKSGRQSEEFYKNLWETVLSGKSWRGEMLNRYKGGKEVYAITTISPIMDDKGNIKHFVAVREDITDLKKLQDKLTHQAHFDALTNLPNRTFFFNHLDNTLAISKRKKHAFALLFIDLDGFKNINDTYGHKTGDKLLIEVSKRIQSSLREADTIARMGGDEFIILLSEIVSNDEPGIMAERIIHMLVEPFEIFGHTCQIGASIGISIYPEHSNDKDELLVLADNAMYKAKASSKYDYLYAK